MRRQAAVPCRGAATTLVGLLMMTGSDIGASQQWATIVRLDWNSGYNSREAKGSIGSSGNSPGSCHTPRAAVKRIRSQECRQRTSGSKCSPRLISRRRWMLFIKRALLREPGFLGDVIPFVPREWVWGFSKKPVDVIPFVEAVGDNQTEHTATAPITRKYGYCT